MTHIEVSPEFASILGLSVEECKELSLRELSNRAFDAGYELHVSTRKPSSDEPTLHMIVKHGTPQNDSR